MAVEWINIAITPAQLFNPVTEARSIQRIIDERKADLVHLRHPKTEIDLIREVLTELPDAYRRKIVIHDYFSLAEDGLCGGIQINSRCHIIPESILKYKASHPHLQHKSIADRELRISKSCHSFEEIMNAESSGIIDYVTLSPIFDSISKTGYKSAFSSMKLEAFLKSCRMPVIALGGVTPEKFTYLQNIGFSGAAMLGYFNKDFLGI